MVQWAVQEGADFIVGETYETYGEAELALRAIKEACNGKIIVYQCPCVTFKCLNNYQLSAWHTYTTDAFDDYLKMNFLKFTKTLLNK